MKPTLEDLYDTFKIGYETYEQSRQEAEEMLNLYHNRQYTDDQMSELENRGQPIETFNVIKLFGRLLLGYYGTVVNAIKITPRQKGDDVLAAVMEDTMKYILEKNNFNSEADKIKLDGMLTGIMASFQDVVDTGEKDEFGRPVREVRIQHVPIHQLVFDPMSSREDYLDARYIHRFKWTTSEFVAKTWGKKVLEELKKEDENVSFLNIDEAEYDWVYGGPYSGYYKHDSNFLIVHSVVVDEDTDKVWSIFWTRKKILEKKELTYKEVRFPYRIHKINPSNKAEHYGIFREIKETQKSINQALLKIQLMANTEKVIYEKGAVENQQEFIRAFNRVNSLTQVKRLEKIMIVDQKKEIAEQYMLIDKGLDRIQRVLGINDSFLGMAFAADSGRKVKLQQNASILSLRYMSSQFEQYYKLLGWDVLNLVKQFYSANQVIRVADERNGHRFVEINQPIKFPMADGGEYTPLEEVTNPEDGKPMADENGNMIIAPIPTYNSDIRFGRFDLIIEASIESDQEERDQFLLDTIIQGGPGQVLQQFSPSDYMYACSLVIRNFKTKNSREIAMIYEQRAKMLAMLENQGMDPNLLTAAFLGGGQSTGGNTTKQVASLKSPDDSGM